jgi:hypothetical protein
LLRGQILNTRTTHQTTREALQQADRLIVKFVRANALLPWLTNQFAFRHKPIHLVRHPFAVVSSQLRHGSWDDEYTGFDLSDDPYSEPYRKHRPFLDTISSQEEKLTALWCLTNLIPLRHPDRDARWITIHYEHLREQLSRLFEQWKMDMPSGMENEMRAPSTTTKRGDSVRDSKKQLHHWQSKLDDEQLDRMRRVLSYFEVEYYGDEALPKTL